MNHRHTIDAPKDYWNNKYSRMHSVRRIAKETIVAIDHAIDYFGDIKDKVIVDIGCGTGEVSIYLAGKGANVIALDESRVATDILRRWCDRNNVNNITVICDDIHSFLRSGKSIRPNFLIGFFILHHIDQFDEFAGDLARILPPTGKAFFWENNAACAILMWFRRNIVGKFGVPKHGDLYESPLSPSEIDSLRKHFKVNQIFPEMYYFRLLSSYLFRGYCRSLMTHIDDLFFRNRLLVKHSYRQYLLLERV